MRRSLMYHRVILVAAALGSASFPLPARAQAAIESFEQGLGPRR
jgi:hypothetical protein